MVFLFTNIIDISKHSLKESEILHWLWDWYSPEEKINCVGFFLVHVVSRLYSGQIQLHVESDLWNGLTGGFNEKQRKLSQFIWDLRTKEKKKKNINTNIQL